jgi:16S rRNA (cytosine1402-N4)-methyltransferase
VIEALSGADEVLDCTLGGGGHSEALLAAGKKVTGIDRDETAIETAMKRLAPYVATGRFVAVKGSFADFRSMPELEGKSFGGILADLGVSSRQLDDETRGFSFRPGAPLDMRMDPSSGETAADLLNTLEEDQLARIFREYGDEPRAYRLARETVRRRDHRPFATSDDFVGAIRGAFGARSGPPDFARLFQSLRIRVNDELQSLERALPLLRDRLTPGGTLAVIAYHSGEDRIVKHAIREWSRDCICPPKQPHCTCRGVSLGEVLTKRATTAGPAEIARNPRARSARLRIWRSAA